MGVNMTSLFYTTVESIVWCSSCNDASCFNSKNSGSFNLNVKGLTVSESLAIKSDNTGRPEVSSISCAASVGSVDVKFHGGARLENPDVVMNVSVSPLLSTLNPHHWWCSFCLYSSWLYNLFSKFIEKALKSALQKQVRDDHHIVAQ